MAGPQNAIIGEDANYGLDLPEAQTDDQAFAEIQKTAKFSKTAEFKALKDHLESRIEFYKTYLPGGQPLDAIEPGKLGEFWAVADRIINEFRAVINAYEEAARTVRDENSRRKNP